MAASWSWDCLTCGASSKGSLKTHEDAIADYDVHADESHPGAKAVSYGDNDPANELAAARATRHANVVSLLAASDKWAARAYEDGVPMSDDRKAYRQALRAAFQQIATSDDPGAVELPEVPAE